MTSSCERMMDGSKHPNSKSLLECLGDVNYKRWVWLVEFIDDNYPGVFAPEWLYGGKKHGWSLRYKKSKSFCTLIPERDRLMIQIVFGKEEREKAEAVLPQIETRAREEYEAATTYHDGKWLFLEIDGDETLADVKKLLAIKRKPSKKP